MGKRRRRNEADGRPLTDLADLRAAVRAHQRDAAARAEAERAAFEHEHRQAIAAAREQRLFAEALGDVVPLRSPDRVVKGAGQPEPRPLQRERDEQEALAATMSDEIDIERYLDHDDALSYTAPSIGPEVVTRMRRGAWKITAQLDLHGLRRDEAREVLVGFLDDCRRNGVRCVRIIHGKGLGSVNREPVLKDKVRKWLVQRTDVLAFCQAPPNDGGAGALFVLLAGTGRDRSGIAR